jgi:hypothetical protein
MKDSGVQIYGWVNPGGNLSTSHTHCNIARGLGGNGPRAYDVYPNTVQLDQATLYLEKDPDEVQMDHWDRRFRFTNLYGTDYKYTSGGNDAAIWHRKNVVFTPALCVA